MTIDLFREHGCSCSPVGLLAAAFAHAEVPLCKVHQADLIAVRDANAELEKAKADHDRIRQQVDDLNAKDELAARRRLADERDAAIDRITDPLEASLTRLSGAALPLNAPLSSFSSLAGLNTTTDHRNFDGPDAA